MSSEINLSVNHSLELFSQLKATCSEFTQKEEHLSRELSARRNNFTRKQRQASELLESQHSKQIAQINAFFEAEEEHAVARNQSRSASFQKAADTAVRRLPIQAQAAKQRWMGDLQMQHFFAGRKLEEELARAEATLAEVSAKLTQTQELLARLNVRAAKAFGGYFAFKRILRSATTAKQQNQEELPPEDCNEQLKKHLSAASDAIDEFRGLLVPRLFSFLPLPGLIILILTGAAVAAICGPAYYAKAGIWAGTLLALAFGLHQIGYTHSKSAASALANLLGQVHQLHADCCTAAHQTYKESRSRAKQEHDQTCAAIQSEWDRAGVIEAEFEETARKKLDLQTPRIQAKLETALASRLEKIGADWDLRLEQVEAQTHAARELLQQNNESGLAEIADDEVSSWAALHAEWNEAIGPIYHSLELLNEASKSYSPPWSPSMVEAWTTPLNFSPATQFARLTFDLATPPNSTPKTLALPGPSQVSIPLFLNFPRQGSLLFETLNSGDPSIIGALNNIALRLLTGSPAGKLAFTIFDPVGLGQNFAGLMHLADYEESLINRRIWTQRDAIEERLAELSEHIEKVIQMYLRNEYSSITEYNAQAGSVAEKYHFIIVADFPSNFSETAIKRLQSIATTGPRCGIFTLIHWDQRQPVPDGLVPEELRRNSISIRCEGNKFILAPEQLDAQASLQLDPPPEPELALALVHKVGKSSIDSNRVEVPFSQIAPKPEEMWTLQTTHELRIPIGRTGATKLQELAIGKGTRQHALFAGKTGSGKSTLFHVIITNLSLACSPDQVEFYLIDFKKGVEFKCYATKRLPHARVVAIESDREFALSVLQRVDEELKRRGDLFRKLGVQDIAGYKRVGGTDPLPRSLLIIDEFQEFFVEDDSIAQTASLLFDRIVRQGRAFGIHVLLGSQTLGGAYSLARATLGQMVIRVALQCNEADAYLIMDDNNSAPRLLSRPGEGIYNDSAGAVAGNSPFQVVWLPDAERDAWLDQVHNLAVQHHCHAPSPIVFEGNAPANVLENDLLRSVLETLPETVPTPARAWLGSPNSIKGPTEAVFEPHSGSNLLIVGQRDESALTMLGLTLLALAAQHPVGSARFLLFHCNSAGSADAKYLETIRHAIGHKLTMVQNQDVTRAMGELSQELKFRSGTENTPAPPVFVFIHGLQKFKKLRNEQEFSFSLDDSESNPGAQFNELICEGASHGMHLIVTVDTFNNINRFMTRKALSEFEMRVIFQMSASDSASLIDSPKASNLGLHRALFYNEQQGHVEIFRPYAPPPLEWIHHSAKQTSGVL